MLRLENDSFANAWVTATVYAVDDQVVNSGTPYICAEAHTSGTFSTDLAAGKWTSSSFRTWTLESVTAVIGTTGRQRKGAL